MGLIKVGGSIAAGPSNASDALQSKSVIKLEASQTVVNSTGVLYRLLGDGDAFVNAGVGPAQAVTRATFLYARSPGAYQLRILQDDGVGGSVETVLQCAGLFVAEFPEDTAAIEVEIASGTAVEYFAAGLE